jgi:hypothetical protein
MLISTWSCAPGVCLWIIFFVRVFALDLVKISKFQFVSCVAQNVFNLESWNLTGMLVIICSCAPWVLLADLSNICRVFALDLVKTVSLYCVFCSSSAWVRINQLYRNNDQHHCEAMHLGLCMCFFFSFVRVIALDVV